MPPPELQPEQQLTHSANILTKFGILHCLSIAVVMLAWSPASLRAADSATEQLIIGCSEGAGDERTIAECITLLFEQAEASLTRVEERWQRSLQAEAEAVGNDALTESDFRSAASEGADSTTNASADSNVIAIVNDTALQSGISTDGSRVINIDEDSESNPGGSGPDNSDSGQTTEAFESEVDKTERFGFLPALFRTYRDQHCAWQASQFGGDRTQLQYQACIASLTERRARELTRLLAVQRSIVKSGRSFSGYYVKTDNGALFQACDRRTDWWVTGTDSVLSALDRRYNDIEAQSIQVTPLLYIEFSGNLTRAPGVGAGADYDAAIAVRDIGLLRPVSVQDCAAGNRGPQTFTGVDGAVESGGSDTFQSDAATVDNFASSGFLYGYFNDWQAACAVTENSVCSAETDAEFASDGGWRLRVDRSLEGDWRIFLIPTTDDQVIEKQLTMKINDSEVFLDKTYPLSMRLPVNQGRALADGELARELIAKFREGRELRLQWFDETDVMSELTFSLQGVTRALEYFDNKQ